MAQTAIDSQRITFRAGTDTALFIGSSSGNRFRGPLPSDGDVRVRVYLMRPAARRKESSTYSLKVGISGAPLAPRALIPGTPYDGSAEVLCGSGSSVKATRCKASVIRRANNSATVVVMNPKGQKRQFLFVKGKAVVSDQPEKLTVQRRGDVSLLGENFERYASVDALVVGG
ncbi:MULTISPECIES: hypothetical protein [unclassified Cyanobium]|uniref:hypothetical protein n=1 Tax=unclassified Cyanobium TaxID=2627006 RepID=UPI0020CD8006|nr:MULTISPECIES: hypothetical protein [unclassified Cyanobium]MCP9834315.1 hypothetical protein [Cyanobium sp. La Preciosa 7G6]MCP9937049.1 hypothetical protein [Cyanobium sp. Aljojuca 7A6]